jgi:hypothetical protein
VFAIQAQRAGTKISPARKGWVHRAGGRAPEVRHNTLRLFIRTVPGFPTSPLSPATTYVVLPKENHMHLTEAATLDRKSGGPEGSAVPRTFLEMFFDRA